MKINYTGPRKYDWSLPPRDKNGLVTPRVTAGLENVLSVYVQIAQAQAKATDNNVENYVIEKAILVGSGAHNNKIDSDLDLLLIAPRLDVQSANSLKAFLQLIYFSDRPKQEAIDIYIRPQDAYPSRANFDLTTQVADILNRYNGLLLNYEEPTTEKILIPAGDKRDY